MDFAYAVVSHVAVIGDSFLIKKFGPHKQGLIYFLTLMFLLNLVAASQDGGHRRLHGPQS